MYDPVTATAVIAQNGTQSGALPVTGKRLLAILVPTLDSATLKIQGSLDGSNWYDVKDTSGNTVAAWAASTGGFLCDGDSVARLLGIPYLRFVAGASQTTAARTFTAVLSR